MTLSGAMYIGQSGLLANGDAMNVVGDNIANINTIGFKEGRTNFQAQIETSIQSNSFGLGVAIGGVSKIFKQGGLQSTGRTTDFALDGKGMFILNGSRNGRDQTFYTRNGDFTVDSQGYLSNRAGFRVQGYQVDSSYNIQPSVGDLKVADYKIPPKVTSTATMYSNFDTSAAVPAAFSAANAAGTSSFSSSITAYDSIGNPQKIDLYFRRATSGATNTWEWYPGVDGARVTGGTAGTPTLGGAEVGGRGGVLTFNTAGKLVSSSSNTMTFSFIGAAASQAITLNFGDDTASGGTGLAGSVSFSRPSTVVKTDQNGYGAGELQSIAFDGNNNDGQINGLFTNGLTKALGQIALATFPAEDQVARVGGTMFLETVYSGQPVVGKSNTGPRGGILSGQLEQSNVDLSQQFTSMISYQRGFQSSSKIITTVDELLAELANLKR